MSTISRNILFTMILVVAVSLPYASYAQDQVGSINGTVYRDINANGVCVNEGEPRVAANIPMELVSDDVGELVRITSAADGSYAYSTNANGLWRVTVVPGTAWRVTSQQTLEVTLTSDSPEVTNIDFCIIEVDQSSAGGGETLPESGAAVTPILLLAAAIGFVLIAAGAGLLLLSHLTKA